MASKADIVDNIADKAGLSKKQAAEALDGALGAISDALGNGDKVQLPGFGTFAVSHRKARTGRNPQTGEPLEIKASNGVGFKAAKALKETVNS